MAILIKNTKENQIGPGSYFTIGWNESAYRYPSYLTNHKYL